MKTENTIANDKVNKYEGETKAERFIRLAQPRVQRTLKDIKALENLTTSNYEYTDEQAEKILNTLLKAFRSLDDKFHKVKEKDVKFTL